MDLLERGGNVALRNGCPAARLHHVRKELPIRNAGLRLSAGSWGTYETSRPRSLRRPARRSAELSAGDAHRAAGDAHPGTGVSEERERGCRLATT